VKQIKNRRKICVTQSVVLYYSSRDSYTPSSSFSSLIIEEQRVHHGIASLRADLGDPQHHRAI
jgi:hypothetical protein